MVINYLIVIGGEGWSILGICNGWKFYRWPFKYASE